MLNPTSKRATKQINPRVLKFTTIAISLVLLLCLVFTVLSWEKQKEELTRKSTEQKVTLSQLQKNQHQQQEMLQELKKVENDSKTKDQQINALNQQVQSLQQQNADLTKKYRELVKP